MYNVQSRQICRISKHPTLKKCKNYILQQGNVVVFKPKIPQLTESHSKGPPCQFKCCMKLSICALQYCCYLTCLPHMLLHALSPTRPESSPASIHCCCTRCLPFIEKNNCLYCLHSRLQYFFVFIKCTCLRLNI